KDRHQQLGGQPGPHHGAVAGQQGARCAPDRLARRRSVGDVERHEVRAHHGADDADGDGEVAERFARDWRLATRFGGEAGIRTLDTAFGPYNGLANRRLQPLGHLTLRLAREDRLAQVEPVPAPNANLQYTPWWCQSHSTLS